MDIKTAISRLVDDQDLDAETMRMVMHTIMQGEATPAQIGGFLVALRMKGETVTEIAAAAEVMRTLATTVDVDTPNLVDTCGTGGDSANTFNISTAAAMVTAAAGAQVAKHGNRAVSSSCGSADVLEAAGVNLELTPEQVADCIRTVGVGFLFAPRHHGAMKHAVGPRKELGLRTIFNLLGPLSNPAGALNQVLGVYNVQWLRPLAEVLAQLGSRHVLVVHADDGLDEISLSSPTRIAELFDGNITCYTVQPEDFGCQRCDISEVVAGTVDESLHLLRAALGGKHAAARDIVALNAGAAIYTSGLTPDLATGVERAQQAIADGSAADKLQQLIDYTRKL